MLTWKKDEHKNNRREIVSTSYLASVPYLGRISIHPHIDSPSEWFLTCQSLNIDRHPLGNVSLAEAEWLAQAELVICLKQHIIWCQSALNEVQSKSQT